MRQTNKITRKQESTLTDFPLSHPIQMEHFTSEMSRVDGKSSVWENLRLIQNIGLSSILLPFNWNDWPYSEKGWRQWTCTTMGLNNSLCMEKGRRSTCATCELKNIYAMWAEILVLIMIINKTLVYWFHIRFNLPVSWSNRKPSVGNYW